MTFLEAESFVLRFSTLTLLLAALVLTACGGGQSGSPSAGSSGGDPAKGKIVFETGVCITCHTLAGATGANGITGPALNGIGTRAATRKPNTTAEAYIRESETNPNAFVVEGFPRDVMPAWSGTAADLNNLIAFLLEQK